MVKIEMAHLMMTDHENFAPSWPHRAAESLSHEWHGEGTLLGRGAFSELGWSLTTLTIGLMLSLGTPGETLFWIVHMRYPAWVVASTFTLAGGMTITGLVLFFVRGRCVGSRLLRLGGDALGLMLWLSVLLISAYFRDGSSILIPILAWAVLGYARSISLAWRRF